MTTIQTKPAPRMGGIESRAMLAHLSISSCEFRRKDKRVTEEVLSDERAERNAGVFTTRIIPPTALAKIGRTISAARARHFQFTSPWSDTGSRILATAMWQKYNTAMGKVRDDFNTAVVEFLNEYPKLVAAAHTRLGGLTPGEYPDVELLRSRFGMSFTYYPVPTAGDFRVEMDHHVLDNIRSEIESNTMASMETATRDLWGRMHEMVERIHVRCSSADGTIRESMLNNARELVELLPAMNITNDPGLETMRLTIKDKLCKMSTAMLQTSPVYRQDAASEAKSILDKMAQFGFKPQ